MYAPVEEVSRMCGLHCAYGENIAVDDEMDSDGIHPDDISLPDDDVEGDAGDGYHSNQTTHTHLNDMREKIGNTV